MCMSKIATRSSFLVFALMHCKSLVKFMLNTNLSYRRVIAGAGSYDMILFVHF